MQSTETQSDVLNVKARRAQKGINVLLGEEFNPTTPRSRGPSRQNEGLTN